MSVDTMEDAAMYVQTQFGLVWVSDQAPYFKDWHGRQAYKYLYAGKNTSVRMRRTAAA